MPKLQSYTKQAFSPDIHPASNRLFLDCPFSEKDEAKAKGARWDKKKTQWYVPSELYSKVEEFNQWRPGGKVYLLCPFAEKDEAKAKGAKWDAAMKKWYVPKGMSSCGFERWLQPLGSGLKTQSKQQNQAEEESRGYSKNSKKKKGADSKNELSRTSAAASLPRVNPDMTVAQLLAECRARNPAVKGISVKKKHELLEDLGVGSVWISEASTTSSKKGTGFYSKGKETASLSSKLAPNTSKQKVRPKSAEKIATKPPPEKKSRKAEKNKVRSSSTKSTSNEEKPCAQVARIALLPRISASLTVAQLNHELHHRDSSVSGTSNKTKDWFLDRLGRGSIMATSSMALSTDLASFPVVSTSMTVAQLTAELMEREPDIKGLSGQSKPWFLKRLVEGSIWITSAPAHSSVPRAKGLNSGTSDLPVGGRKKKAITSRSASVARGTASTSTEKGSTNASKGKRRSAVPHKPSGAVTNSGTSDLPVGRKKASTSRSASIAHSTASTSTEKRSANASKGKKRLAVPHESSGAVTSKKAKPGVKKEAATLDHSRRSNSTQKNQKKEPEKTNLPGNLATTIPVIWPNMSVAELKEECKARDPNMRGLSNKDKAWLLDHLGVGSEREASSEWRAKQDKKAHSLHKYVSLCHHHPLADSSKLRSSASVKYPRATSHSPRRSHTAVCDENHMLICQQTPFRSCEECDYDICKACFEIESLEEPNRREMIKARHIDYNRKQLELQHRLAEEQRRVDKRRKQEKERREEMLEEKYQEDISRFPPHVRTPNAKHLDSNKKLKFTIWKSDRHRKQSSAEKEFDSSFATLEEANLRVEYVFFYKNPWGCEKDEIFADKDHLDRNGFRVLENCPDGGGSWTVSALPSAAFGYIDTDFLFQEEDNQSMWPWAGGGGSAKTVSSDTPVENSFPSCVRQPKTKNLDKSKMLKYTVWTSCGYDYDGWHSYEGPPEKLFNSSFPTLEEANRRVEYVFWYENPWGISIDEMHLETDKTNKEGLTLKECRPDDSERWTVSVVPSVAFDFINL